MNGLGKRTGLLIKGMEMPKHGCDHCFLRTGNYCGRIKKDEPVVEYARKSERHPDCPLVEVPDHGDLVDRNWLLSEYERLHIGAPGGAYRIIQEAPTVLGGDEKNGDMTRGG